ncbi:hypothetical protein C8R44DRAFT_807136 [Mycena epipterygia]|nr:hypothetical protein C8R44DRAFT_807136 [Mycena epipterygia]
MNPVINYLSLIATEKNPVLLVLDGLEPSWKAHKNRSAVEYFLSLLSNVQHLSLIVTIRGDQHPGQVRWTRPFPASLRALPVSAAREMLLGISDISPDDPGLDEILAITKNNPGTIRRITDLASFEGCVSLIARWQVEEDMHDKGSRAEKGKCKAIA